jgi:hypothetical protein
MTATHRWTDDQLREWREAAFNCGSMPYDDGTSVILGELAAERARFDALRTRPHHGERVHRVSAAIYPTYADVLELAREAAARGLLPEPDTSPRVDNHWWHGVTGAYDGDGDVWTNNGLLVEFAEQSLLPAEAARLTMALLATLRRLAPVEDTVRLP